MKRVFITGGGGFIGSHVVDALVERGDEVLVADSFSPEVHRAEPDYLNPGAQYLRRDIREPDTWDAACSADVVIHLAGKVGLGVSFADTPSYVSHNDVGTASGLAHLAASGSSAPIILASSMVVYGEGRYGCAEHGLVSPGPREESALASGIFDPPCPLCGQPLTPLAVPEDAPLAPRNVYAATKVHQEHLLWSYCRELGVRGVALRFHNVYGPRMPADTPYSGVAAMFASAALAGGAPQVFEDGQQLRDFVHVRDVASAVIAAADLETASGAYNVGSGHARPIIDMAQAIVAAVGSGPPPQVVGRWRLGDVRHVFADSSRMKRELGVAEPITVEAGAVDVVHDASHNQSQKEK